MLKRTLLNTQWVFKQVISALKLACKTFTDRCMVSSKDLKDHLFVKIFQTMLAAPSKCVFKWMFILLVS